MIGPTDLKYFIEIAKIQHVSRAAERLGITQPALSHCIQRMEQSVGTELFLRSKKGVSLTPAGQRLYDQAQALIQQWESVVHSLQSDQETVGGFVRLGCHSAVAQYTLPYFLPKLLQEFPKIKMHLSHGLSRHMTEEVISGKSDVAIVVNPVSHPDLVIKELCRDVVTLWRTKKGLNPNLLILEPSLLQTQDILKKLNKKGFAFEQTLESASLEVIAQLLAAHTGSAILPQRVAHAFHIPDLIQVEGAPVFHDRICLIYKPEFKKTRTGRTLIERSVAALEKT